MAQQIKRGARDRGVCEVQVYYTNLECGQAKHEIKIFSWLDARVGGHIFNSNKLLEHTNRQIYMYSSYLIVLSLKTCNAKVNPLFVYYY